MRIIGIRVQPSEVIFAIYDSDEREILNIEFLKIPKALKAPDYLKYIRNHVIDILDEYQVSVGGIRITESNSKTKSIERIQIEGVIQEAFSSSTLNYYYTGQISTIASKLGIIRSDFKRYVDGEINYEEVDNWADLTKNEREAILTAIGAI